MASVSWTATSSGSWNNAANWSAAPQQGDDVAINTPGSSITVTYSTGSLALDSLTTGAGDTLDMTGGTLSTADGFNLGGALVMSGGTLRLAGLNNSTVSGSISMSGGSLIFAGGATISGGALNQTSGTITINHGALLDQDGGSLAGTLGGSGAFVLSAGQGVTTFQSGFVLATGSVDVASGTVFLQESLNYANKFSLAQAGTLDLNGHAGTLTGYAALDGDINGGSLTVSGGGHLNSMILDNGAVLTVQNSINQSNNITLGGPTGTGTLDVTSKGTLRVTGNDYMYQGAGAGFLVNDGLIEKTAGNSQAGTMVIFDTVTNAASGTIDAAIGTIDFRGPNGGQSSSISGTIEGAGTIAFDNGSYILSNVTLNSNRFLFSGSTSSANITLATALTFNHNWQQNGGLLLLENNLTLNGTSAFDGGELKGTATVTDSGPLLLGTGMDLEGNLTFMLEGPVDQTGGINLGYLSDSVDQATLTSGNTWALEGASSITGAYGTITISNGATFTRLDGAQNAVVGSTVINNGALVVNTGTLSLTGQGTLAGTVSGGAVLDISGQFALASGLALSVGELILDAPSQANDIQASLGGNLSYAHDFAIEGGTLALNGHTLTLGGISSFDTGAIQGSGVVVDNGAATILNVALTQGGQLVFNGATEQAGNVTLTGGSTAPVLSIGAGGVYTMDNATSIGGPSGSVVGTLTVAGELVAAGPGTSVIGASVVNTGTIAISHGQMAFLGPLSGAGAITISAGGILDLDSSNATTAGIGFGTGGGLLYLNNPSGYDGTIGGFASGDAVELNGFAFSNNGTPTTFSVSGDTVTISEAQGGPSTTLTFSSAQSASQLMLGVGPHSGLALIHI